jgi:formylglycine-generating enzyme
MRTGIFVVAPVVVMVSCHSLVEQEHRRSPGEEEPTAGVTAGGSSPTNDSGDLSGIGYGGISGDGGAPLPTAGGLAPVEGGEGGRMLALGGEAGSTGHAGVAGQPTSSHCGDDLACGDDLTCTSDGVCIAKVRSCEQADTPGCGVVTISGGSFKMGWSAAHPEASAGQPISVDTFVIDAHEVSVARFRVFWEAGHPTAPPITYPDGQIVTAGPAVEPGTTDENEVYNWSIFKDAREAHPINQVLWPTAFAFCAWDGGRLPTEAEWEYTATGRAVGDLSPGRTYPWGEVEPTCDLLLANTLDCGLNRTVAVDAQAGYGGVFQQAGNVSEWTADHYEEYGVRCWDGTARVNPLCYDDGLPPWTLKGGSFLGYSWQTVAAWRMGSESLSAARGMRCARDVVAK